MHCLLTISTACGPLPMTWSAPCSVSARMSTARPEPLQALMEHKAAAHRAAIPEPLKANTARYNVKATLAVAFTIQRSGPPTPCIVGAGLAPALKNPVALFYTTYKAFLGEAHMAVDYKGAIFPIFQDTPELILSCA